MMGLFMAVTLGIAQMAIPVLADETEEILLLKEAEAEEEFALEEEEGIVGLGIDLEEVIEESEKAEIPEEEISEAEIVLGGTDALETENVDNSSDAEEAVVPEISIVEVPDDEVVMEVEIIEEEELPLFDATSGSVSEGTCGENLTWTLDADGTLTISGTGEMADYESAEAVPWNQGNSENPKVKALVLDENITHIGDYAFYACEMTTVELPKNLVSIGAWAFASSGLTEVVIPDSVTTIKERAFASCSALESITIPSSVTTFGTLILESCSETLTMYSYLGATAVEYAKRTGVSYEIVYPSYGECGDHLTWTMDADGTLTISGSGPMWEYGQGQHRCPWRGNITKKVILDDNITRIGEMSFLGCDFETIDLPQKLTSIGGSAFWQCGSLTDITIPDTVMTIENGAFVGCSSLVSVELPETLNKIPNNLFLGCASLSSVALPDTVTAIGERAFERCTGLSEIIIPAAVKTIGISAFANCDSTFVIRGYLYSAAHQYAIANDISFDALDQPAGTEEGITWKLENGILTVSGSGMIPNYASAEEAPWAEAVEAGEVTAIVVSDGITKVGDYAFAGCAAESVELPDTLMMIGKYAFSNCSNLTEVTIPGNVAKIGDNAFENCGSLQTVIIPSSVKTFGSNIFTSHGKELTIYSPVGSTASIYVSNLHDRTILSRILYPSTGYCGVDLEWTLEEDGTLTITGSGDMFDSYENAGTYSERLQAPWYKVASSIKTVIIDDRVTHIGDRAFENCSIENIELPQSLKTIGNSAFTRTKLAEVSIPEGVTEIGALAFNPCKNLTKAFVPSSVTTIRLNGFVANVHGSSQTLSIYGKAGSYAQTYAEENNIPFVAVTALGEVTLPETSFVYTGSAIEPEPVVCDEDGNALVRDTNYTVTYADNTGIGTATVTVTGMDSCTGEAQLTFEIVMPFGDVPTDYEYYNEIADIFMRGLMTGMNETTFEPETTMNRAFMAAVLYRRAGYPAQPFQPIFPDVKEEDWFAECVLWAQASGNMYGYNEGTFGPTDELNREQLCTILWRYAVTTDGVDNSAKANLEDYPDSKRVSDFAKDAISWCIATGIFEDRDGRLDAWQPATRAELAVMLSRYLAVAGK